MDEIFGEYLDKYTYEYLLKMALSRIPDDVDKRQGSIIFDALAPTCYMLATGYADMKLVLQRAFAASADGIYLERRLNERGLEWKEATPAEKKAIFKDAKGQLMNIPLESKFKTITVEGGLIYTAKEQLLDELTGDPIVGTYRLVCDEAGVMGNTYTGELLSISYIPNLTEATMEELITGGRDRETDADAYIRYESVINEPPFGGNFSDYKEKVGGLNGIGQVQVYPTWNGGGTVKISATDPENNQLTQQKINEIAYILDPPNAQGTHGDGLGVAPIGHRVTVTTPTKVTIAVSVRVAVLPGWTLGQITPKVTEQINKYFNTVISSWGKEQNEFKNYSSVVYRANITAYTLQVPGIATVLLVRLNNADADVILQETSAVQEIPVMGVVNVYT